MPSSRRSVPLCNSPRPEKQSKDALTIDPLNDLDWKAVEPTKYRPFKPIYHITMGKLYRQPILTYTLASREYDPPLPMSQLTEHTKIALKADTPSELITVDTDYFDRVSLRRQIISQHGALVHGCLPAGVEAVNELYQFLLKDYLPTRFPTMFQLRDQGRRFENLVTGQTFPTAVPEDPAAALRALSETVEEDMFLLIGEPEGHRAVAFQCCFPSGFDPSSKVGKLLREIHSPVPSYDKIGPSMERFFSKIEVGKNVKRTNVSCCLRLLSFSSPFSPFLLTSLYSAVYFVLRLKLRLRLRLKPI